MYNGLSLNLIFVKINFFNWIITGKLWLVRNILKLLGGLHYIEEEALNVIEEVSNFWILYVDEASRDWWGTTWNSWEDFTDIVEDALKVFEEVSNFWNLYVVEVRTICLTLYAVYR